jgi:hypothetical protein
MSHTVTITELFLIAMLIIFTVPYLIWRVFRTDYWAPLVVVQILTGILLGPGVLGAAFPDYYAFVFRPEVIQALNGVAWWAVMMFVWFAGVELDLNEAWRRKSETGSPSSRPCCSGPVPPRSCWPPATAGPVRRARSGRWCWASAWPAPSPPCRS